MFVSTFVHTRLVNLTPHSVVINGIEFAPEPESARLTVTEPQKERNITVGEYNPLDPTWAQFPSDDDIASEREYFLVPVFSNPVYSNVTGLPEPKKGFIYLVSLKVAEALPNRIDLCCGYGAIRDEKGKIVGMVGITFPNVKNK